MSRSSAPPRHENPYARLTEIAPPDLATAPGPRPLPPALTSDIYNGTSGDDDFTGTANPDVFNMEQAGHDSVTAKGGADEIHFGKYFDAGDQVSGGTGYDKVFLSGGVYSGGFELNGAMLQQVEEIRLAPGPRYSFTTTDDLVAAGEELYIYGYGLGATDRLAFDGSAETDGSFTLTGGYGSDTLTGGAGADSFYSSAFSPTGGDDTMAGNAGNDIFTFGPDYTGADTVDGGVGDYDIMIISGDYSAGITIGNGVTNLEQFYCAEGFDYKVKIKDANAAAGTTFTIVGSALTGGNTLIFDGSAEANSFLYIGGGTADDVLVGGALADLFQGKGGADTLQGNGGDDVFEYLEVSHSTSTDHDTVVKFDANHDRLSMAGGVLGIDQKVTVGKLASADFDADLEAAIGDGELAPEHAVLFTPSSGNLAGALFVIIDENEIAGYQAGEDWVIRLTNASHMGSFSMDNF